MRRRLTSLALSLMVLFGTLLPGQSVQAAGELPSPTATVATERMSSHSIQPDTLISTQAKTLEFWFGQYLNSDSLYRVTVRDSQGNDPGWTPSFNFLGRAITLTTGAPNRPLKPNETYTITFPGGPNGIIALDGQTLSADVVYTLHTTDAFTLVDAEIVGDLEFGVVPSGGETDQGVGYLHLQFTDAVLYAPMTGLISMTDSQGNAVPVDLSGGERPWVNPTGFLAPNETYTVHVKGGTDGIKRWDGQTLPADLDYTFTTRPGSLVYTNTRYELADRTNQIVTGTVPRTMAKLQIELNRGLDCTTVTGKVSLLNSQGNAAGWTVQCDPQQAKRITLLQPAQNPIPLKNETYTVQIKGGAEGVRSAGGLTLASDLVVPFTTSGESVSYRYSRGANLGAEFSQSESYAFSAEAGPLTIDLTPYGLGYLGTQVTVIDTETHEVILNEWFDLDHKSATVNLPKAGTYYLDLSSAQIGGISVKATELQMDLTNMPALRFTAAPTPFETKNQPFTVTAVVLDPSKAESLILRLGRERLGEVPATTSPMQVSKTVDPTQMADGLYWIEADATGKGNDNLAWQQVPFLVDRVDTYTDVSRSHWARPYIEVMSHEEILAGKGDGLFNPDRPVRRDEFAKILAATLGLKATNTAAMPFVDMKNDWSKPYLQAVYEAGYMKGEVVNGKRYFKPDQTISRAEAAVTIARVLGYDNLNITGYQSSFKDWASVPTWARPSVAALAQLKWINGLPDGSYGPWNSLNRDQAAKVLANFLGMK